MNFYTLHSSPRVWDIFCRVIDNYGDLGVCWRLATQLAQQRQTIRLWVDDASALAWMAPKGHVGISVHAWPDERGSAGRESLNMAHHLPKADVWVEAFGCEIPSKFIAINALNKSDKSDISTNSLAFPIWINLEYLSAEAYVERCHRLPSPVMSGPARGATKHFFYPGFTSGTGGLLREHDLLEQQAVFDRSAWLMEQGIAYTDQETLVSLFCYEPAVLPNLLMQWAQAATPTRVLVTHGRAQHAIDRALSQLGKTWMGWQQLRLHPLPALSQTAFDRLLWACDVNAVRGEDSLVRALWAGKPVLWHIYPQDDDAHLPKLDAFLQGLSVPVQWQQLHAAWNAPLPSAALVWRPLQTDVQACFTQAREKLLSQDDLCTQLITFIEMHSFARAVG